jgi:excisionase family DNA binding protein
MDSSPTVTILEACALASVSRRTIYSWIRTNKVEYVRTAGGAIRIFADSLWRDATGNKLAPEERRP